jgi:transcriptional regulator with XRE-family HTH domain
MPSATEQRKAKQQRYREFRAALALAGITGEQYATQEEVSTGHLWQVARGERPSPTLEPAIAAFIAKHLISRTVTAA